MAIKIDTGIVKTTANQIEGINKKIRDDFYAVDDAIKGLNNNWHGNASDAAIKKFNDVRNTYYDNRYNVINDMTTFIQMQIGERYSDTETAIVSAASVFK